MKQYDTIHNKLKYFISKYYRNEILKGGILFLSFGLLYFLIVLIVEYFLWLQPIGRTILFWFFVAIEVVFLSRFVVIPVLKLAGLKNGITEVEASKIIGRHFKEVDDKLLNLIQLKGGDDSSDLLEASIEQKAAELQPIPFRNAIVLNQNVKYLKYLLIPVAVWALFWLTGNNGLFTESLNRIVHHQTAFSPPAPFYFEIENEKLETIEDESYVLKFRALGSVIPENVKIIYEGKAFYINNFGEGMMEHTFEFPIEDIDFFLEGNNVRSQAYQLKVIQAPKISDFKMELKFPDYLNRNNEIVSSTGNAVIPTGTEVSWKIMAANANRIEFVSSVAPNTIDDVKNLSDSGNGLFTVSKRILKDVDYEIRSSNSNLKDFEKLSYSLKVIKDEYPKIFVNSDIDSVRRGPVQFLGQLTDDYGISRLQVVAKNVSNGAQSMGKIDITSSDLVEFFYVFPEGIILEEGESYEIFFEVYDNDGIKGPKKTKSDSFFYKNKSQEDEEKEILGEQKQGMNNIQDSKEAREKLDKSMGAFSKKLKNKENINWNDKEQLDEFLERQKKYQEMMDKNVDKMMENLDEMDEPDNDQLNRKNNELKKRWEEMKSYKDKEDLIKELELLAEKLEKDELIEKVDELKEQGNQEKRSIERILELTRQFYVEKKSAQIMNQLKALSEKQFELSVDDENNVMQQEVLNQEFDSIQKDFDELRNQNKELKNPMDLFESEADEKLIEMEMKEAARSLEESEDKEGKEEEASFKKAKNGQEAAAKKMAELSKKMESQLMDNAAKGMEIVKEDLQQVLKNLLKFSLEQEALMLSFDDVTAGSADYPGKVKEQIKLKEHFEHIDDSLYSLSLRVVELTSDLQKDLSIAHYNLDKSLENMAENRIQKGMQNQRFTMTAANSIADILSDLLQNMQNQSGSPSKGKGKGELSLPDIIKKQQGMMKEMSEKMGGQKGQGKKGKETLSGEQYKMYQEQKLLKERLKELLDFEGNGGQEGKAALEQMEQLEKILLEKGITQGALQRMQQLEHELLELENASLQRKMDVKRESKMNQSKGLNRSIDDLNLENFSLKEDELLRREVLELEKKYQKKVKKYFEANTKE